MKYLKKNCLLNDGAYFDISQVQRYNMYVYYMIGLYMFTITTYVLFLYYILDYQKKKKKSAFTNSYIRPMLN